MEDCQKLVILLINSQISKECFQFKIICLVRENDWQAAALAFTVGSSLNQFSEKEKQLLLNYLDPDIEMNYIIGC